MNFKNIQGLRALAVLLVICSHFNGFADHFNYDFDLVNAFGQWGVDLFFVISGFIMITVHWTNFQDPGVSKTFLLRRVIRIVPMYWMLTLLIAIAFRVSPHIARGWDASVSLPWSLSLLPMTTFPLLFVGWTLVFEMYFYYVFAALLNLPRKRALGAFAFWAAVIVIAQFFPRLADNPWARVYLGNVVLEFMMGVLAGALVVQHKIARPVTSTALGLVSICGSVVFATARHIDTATTWPLRFIFVGIPMALIVYGCVGLERLRGRVFPQILQSIGDASYSVYLCHAIFYAVLGHLLLAVAGSWTPPLAVILLAPVPVLLASLAVYRFVEIPVTRAARTIATRVFPVTMTSKRVRT